MLLIIPDSDAVRARVGNGMQVVVDICIYRRLDCPRFQAEVESRLYSLHGRPKRVESDRRVWDNRYCIARMSLAVERTGWQPNVWVAAGADQRTTGVHLVHDVVLFVLVSLKALRA